MTREEFYHFMWEFYELYDEQEILKREIAAKQPFIQRMFDKGYGDVAFQVIEDRQDYGKCVAQDN